MRLAGVMSSPTLGFWSHIGLLLVKSIRNLTEQKSLEIDTESEKSIIFMEVVFWCHCMNDATLTFNSRCKGSLPMLKVHGSVNHIICWH